MDKKRRIKLKERKTQEMLKICVHGFPFSSQHNSKGRGEWWSDFKYFNNAADTETSCVPEKYSRIEKCISMFFVPGRCGHKE